MKVTLSEAAKRLPNAVLYSTGASRHISLVGRDKSFLGSYQLLQPFNNMYFVNVLNLQSWMKPLLLASIPVRAPHFKRPSSFVLEGLNYHLAHRCAIENADLFCRSLNNGDMLNGTALTDTS